MNSDLKLAISALLVLLFASVCVSQMREIIGFRVPEYDEENRLKSELSGDMARFVGEDEVHITNLKIETFKDDQVDTRATSPECIYYRSTRNVESESSIVLERENMVITGRDYFYDHVNNVFTIKRDAKVVIKTGDDDFLTRDKE